MRLYEVNQEIENLLEALEPDPETGEIPANEDEIIAQINTLAMKREDILSYLAKLALDVKASTVRIPRNTGSTASFRTSTWATLSG